MFREPEAWKLLMEKLTDITAHYLVMQIEAGADAIQVFDSWVGGLHPHVYEKSILPYMTTLFNRLSHFQKPLIHFGTGTGILLPLLKQAGGDVIGVDWKTPLNKAWQNLGYDSVGVQGNLDPAVLLASEEVIKLEIDKVLNEADGRAGHIFNLGHGVWPHTSEDAVKQMVDYVHEKSSA